MRERELPLSSKIRVLIPRTSSNGYASLMKGEKSVMAKQTLPADVREAGLRTVASILYLAASPDEADGLSDLEYSQLKEKGPAFFETYGLVQRVLPSEVQLPEGFAQHFVRDVLPDLERVRSDASSRNQFRSEVRDTLNSPSKMDRLYTPGGDSFSAMLERAAEHTPNTHGLGNPTPASFPAFGIEEDTSPRIPVAS